MVFVPGEGERGTNEAVESQISAKGEKRFSFVEGGVGDASAIIITAANMNMTRAEEGMCCYINGNLLFSCVWIPLWLQQKQNDTTGSRTRSQ